MSSRQSPSADIALGIVLIAVAVIVFYGTLELPPGSFEPLGSASIPQFVCGGIIVFCDIEKGQLAHKAKAKGHAQRLVLDAGAQRFYTAGHEGFQVWEWGDA